MIRRLNMPAGISLLQLSKDWSHVCFVDAEIPVFPAFMLLVLLAIPSAQGEEVQQTSHVQPLGETNLESATPVRFLQVPAAVGDRVTQQVAMELNLQTAIIQAEQIAQQQDTVMKRGQRRDVEVLEVSEGKVRRARVSFPHSRHQLPEHGDDTSRQIQPVEGKTYELTREGTQLQVKYTDGTIPPQDEFEIVFNSMHSLGMPNPLASFLLDRTFHVGQTIQLPKKVAETMLGLGPELGQISKFELTLTKLEPHSGFQCGVFEANIQMGEGTSGAVSLEAKGPVIIRLDTCRTVLADFSGPLRMNSVEQTPQGSYQHVAEGKLRVAVRSDYAQ